MDPYMMLQAASLGISIFSGIQDHNDQTAQAYAKYDQASRQSAVNNGLAYNNYLHLNEEQILKTKEYSLNTFDLQKAIRRAKATERVQAESQGASTGGSFDARIRNVQRQGSEAINRKDINFQVTLRDFQLRRKNVELETLSANNRAFSGLSTPPSATGLVTKIAGLGISKYVDVGYFTDNDGKIKPRFK
jgi:hypothetical protein